MNKGAYIMVMIFIAFILLMLNAKISAEYIDTKFWQIFNDVCYVLITGGIGILLYRKVEKI